jgi:enediyne biosynthesis protein E4
VETSPLRRRAPPFGPGKPAAGRGFRAAACLLGCAAPAFAIAPQSIAASLAGGQSAASAPASSTFEFRELPPDASGVDFVHGSGASGTAKRFMIECVGTGIGLFDADGDGDLDLYCVQGGKVEPNGGFEPVKDGDRLYLNDGAARFRRAPKCETGSGFGFGVSAADVDGDADVDLFLADLGPERLLLNDGAAHLRPAAEAGGAAGAPRDWSMCGAFGDPDADGDLDLYVANYLDPDPAHPMLASGRPCRWLGCEVPCGPRGLTPQADRFFLNDDGGRFSDATAACGFASAAPAYAFQAAWTDVDDDGRLDLFVANDSMPAYLFRNLGSSGDAPVRFKEQGLLAGCALSDIGKELAGMGVAVGDLDGDLSLDLVMTNFSQEQNAVFRNESRPGEPSFFDDAGKSGLGWPSFFDLGWGASLLDADLDGDLDLLVANGHVYPHVDGCGISQTTYAQRLRLYEQTAPGRFRDATDGAGAALQKAGAHRGCAAGDLDGDGRTDLAVAVLDGPPRLLLNASRSAGRAARLVLSPPERAVGARVTLTDGTRSWEGEGRAGSSFLSAEDPAALVVGVAPDAVLTARVRWPGGAVELFRGLHAGTSVLQQGAGEAGP